MKITFVVLYLVVLEALVLSFLGTQDTKTRKVFEAEEPPAAQAVMERSSWEWWEPRTAVIEILWQQPSFSR